MPNVPRSRKCNLYLEDSGKETVPDDGKEKKHFQNNGLNFFLSIYIFLL